MKNLPKLGVQKQLIQQSKSKLMMLELSKEDFKKRMANMDETVKEIEKKFINSVEDTDQAAELDAGDQMNQIAQTSSDSSSFDKIIYHHRTHDLH
uniref:Uncharacterized protein n=1 Tax=Romanomermis culicivorax TaxID=13658 RepID=A0A915IDS9_ROMCU